MKPLDNPQEKLAWLRLKQKKKALVEFKKPPLKNVGASVLDGTFKPHDLP